MKVRKLIVNTFIREVILYPDRVVITYNFTDNPEHIKFTKEHVVKTEKEIETADKTAFSSLKGSYIYGSAAPSRHTQKERTKLRCVCLFLCKTGVNCRFRGSLPFLLFLRVSP